MRPSWLLLEPCEELDECDEPELEELDEEPWLTEPPELPLGGRVDLASGDATADAVQHSTPSATAVKDIVFV